MRDRILEIGEVGGLALRVNMEQLVIEREGRIQHHVPLEELACLVVSHPHTRYSQPVLSGLARHGAVLVICDERRRPCSMLLPLEGHSLQSERFQAQAQASQPTLKRIWQGLIREKLRNQGRLLHKVRGDDGGLLSMVPRVRSGDPDNLEAQGARRYWSLLQPEPEFKRDPERSGFNALLNYGYAVLRAVVVRACCAAGLHPSLGVHHHNRYNAFCLADDLMEPFRPLVDRAALEVLRTQGAGEELSGAQRAALLRPLTGLVMLDGEQRSLFDGLGRMCSSLVGVFMGERQSLLIPTLHMETDDGTVAVQDDVADCNV
ncbi:MAG: type II CRISPR-associated endonuclease Cas1 [Myxococcota bacterium]